MRLKGRSAVKPHRGEQDSGCGKEVERERFQEKRGSKEEYMRKLDQTPTSLVQLCGAAKQLPLDVDERVNRSWERADSVKIAGNADERGLGAVRREAGQELGRICEAGAVTRWGRNERQTESQSTKQGTGDPTMVTAVRGDQREKQLTEAERGRELFIQQCISNLPELSKLRDAVGIYFKKKD